MSVVQDRGLAAAWLNIRWRETIFDKIPKRTLARATARWNAGDPGPMGIAAKAVVDGMTAKEKKQYVDAIVAEMPRRLRRAMGHRGYSQAGRHMAMIRSRHA